MPGSSSLLRSLQDPRWNHSTLLKRVSKEKYLKWCKELISNHLGNGPRFVNNRMITLRWFHHDQYFCIELIHIKKPWNKQGIFTALLEWLIATYPDTEIRLEHVLDKWFIDWLSNKGFVKNNDFGTLTDMVYYPRDLNKTV